MKKILLTTVVYLLVMTPAAFANDEGVGLFITHKSGDATAYEAWYDTTLPVLDAHQCTSFRKGQLLGGNGSFQWDQANQFSIFVCQSPVLADLVGQGHYSALVGIAENISMIEGDLHRLSDSEPSNSSEYIIKISYFNNLKTAARGEALSYIGGEARTIDGAWVDDAILIPTASMGLMQPDDLTFIYYPKAGQGETFRKENSEILKKIGAFNQEHLTHFIYLSGLLKK